MTAFAKKNPHDMLFYMPKGMLKDDLMSSDGFLTTKGNAQLGMYLEESINTILTVGKSCNFQGWNEVQCSDNNRRLDFLPESWAVSPQFV